MSGKFHIVGHDIDNPGPREEFPGKGKPRIKQNVWGNWNAYRGTSKVIEFGLDERGAKDWLEEQK